MTHLSGVTTLWYNGVSQGTTSNSIDFRGTMLFGELYNGAGQFLDGQSDEIRITEGVARYTSAFTPPGAAFPTSSVGDAHWSNVRALLSMDAIDTTDTTAYKLLQAARVRPGAAFAALTPKRLASAVRLRDQFHGGRGRIVATVKEDASPVDLPLHRRVWLLRQRDALVVRETWSNAVTGAYAFENIDERERYAVMSFDHLGVHRAVIADNLAPELMT